MGTQPPLFTQIEDPLDADAWLHTMESKFALLVGDCSEANMAKFAAQQLRGPAQLWWKNYTVLLQDNHVVTWTNFHTAFRAHHIPKGLMGWKLNEFLALTQGSRIVSEYAHLFNNLSQYASYHMDSDPKKQDRFRRGLSTKLKDHLALVRPSSYNDLVNMAIVQEDAMAAHRAEKKRKAPMPPPDAPSQKYTVAPNF